MAADQNKNLLLQTITSKVNKYQNGVLFRFDSQKVSKRLFASLYIRRVSIQCWMQYLVPRNKQ